jgi:hypothetical protein
MKKAFGAVLMVVCLTVVISSAASASTIYYSWGGNYAVVINDLYGMDWDTAMLDVTATLGSGYHLATITSQSEQNAVQHLVSSVNSVNPVSELWMGGVQNPIDEPVADANWTWITGEIWSFTYWNGGEPNDGYGPASEQWLGMWSDGTWNDEGALGNINGYIAERHNKVPEPSTVTLIGLGLLGVAAGRLRAMKK